MMCQYNPPLDDVELLMALDGAASPEVEMHVSQCFPCSQRAAELAGAQQTARDGLLRAACPPSLALGEYHLKLLPASQHASIGQHVATCLHCQQELTQLTSFMNAPDPYLHPPLPDVIKQRVRVLVARLASAPQPGGLFAAPARTPALAGLRGAQDGPLTYEAGDAQIILEIQADGAGAERKSILGLVVGLVDQQAQVHLWREEQPMATTTVDGLGSFAFDGLAPGRYELFVNSDGHEIHVQDLSV